VVTASEALRNGYQHGKQSQPQSQHAGDQAQPTYSTAESFQHPTAYSDSLPGNSIPPTTSLPAQPQHQQQRTYNVQPPAPPIPSAQPQQAQTQQYDDNNAYQITLPPTTSPLTTTTATPPNNHPTTHPFMPNPSANYQATPHQNHHNAYPTQTDAPPMYPPAAIIYPPTSSDNFSSTNEMYSIPPGMWPMSIVQYQNTGM
jgi:hypothetical protein